MEYWEIIAAIAGGLVVLGGIIQVMRTYITKKELHEHCSQQMKIVSGNIKIAVLEAMNEWLQQNGKRLKG